MIRARWWPLIGRKAGDMKAPRRRKRARKVFLGPEIILSGELTSCDTLVAEGTVDSRRIECRKFILRRAGFCKGVVQAETAVISGRFEGHLIVQARLVIKSGGQVGGSVQYGQIEIEPGGELQGDMLVHPTPKHAAEDELDILDIAIGPKSGRPTRNSSAHKLPLATPSAGNDQSIEITEKPAA